FFYCRQCVLFRRTYTLIMMDVIQRMEMIMNGFQPMLVCMLYPFKTSSVEEITYSLLKERICRKMGIDPFAKRLNLGYIPLVVEPKRQSYILDDEDVYVYLTSVDREQRRSILHVEDIEKLQIVRITEQLSGVGEISCSRNYCERESGYGEEKNVGTGLEHGEHPHKKHKKSRL
ncbi:unnamed protein product, partial [Brassica rapa]